VPMAAGAGAAPARLRVERAGPGGGSGARGRESLIHRRRRRGTAGPRHAPRPAAAPGAAAGLGPRRQPAGQTASGAAAGGAGGGERSGAGRGAAAAAGLLCSAGGCSGTAGAAEGGRLWGPLAAPLLEGWSAESTAGCRQRKERRAARSQRYRRIPPRPLSPLPTPPQLHCNRTPERRARPTSGAEGRRGIFRPSECGKQTVGPQPGAAGLPLTASRNRAPLGAPGAVRGGAASTAVLLLAQRFVFTARAERREERGRRRALSAAPSGGRVPQAERRGSCRGARHRADSSCRGTAPGPALTPGGRTAQLGPALRASCGGAAGRCA